MNKNTGVILAIVLGLGGLGLVLFLRRGQTSAGADPVKNILAAAPGLVNGATSVVTSGVNGATGIANTVIRDTFGVAKTAIGGATSLVGTAVSAPVNVAKSLFHSIF